MDKKKLKYIAEVDADKIYKAREHLVAELALALASGEERWINFVQAELKKCLDILHDNR